jgi:hypothetical protein
LHKTFGSVAIDDTANMHIIDSKPTQNNLCKKKVLSDDIAQGALHCIAYIQIQNPYRFLQDKVIELEEA